MRRVALMTAGLALVMSVGFTGAAGASGSIAAKHVKAGSTWAYIAKQPPYLCEAVTFARHGHTWTADMNGDQGTYTGGAKKIKLVWTSGTDASLTFNGSWTGAAYLGTLSGLESGRADLQPGSDGC